MFFYFLNVVQSSKLRNGAKNETRHFFFIILWTLLLRTYSWVIDPKLKKNRIISKIILS